MKKSIGLIVLLIIIAIIYKYLTIKKEEQPFIKTSKPIAIDNKIKKEIDYSKLKLEKKLITKLPSETDYQKEKYQEVEDYVESVKKEKEKDFNINSNLDFDKDERKLDSATIQIMKKF